MGWWCCMEMANFGIILRIISKNTPPAIFSKIFHMDIILTDETSMNKTLEPRQCYSGDFC